jgi:hypothetical protein
LHLLAKGITLLLGELFGIVEYSIVIVGRKNDGSRKHASSQTATAGLVATGLYTIGVVMTLKHLTNKTLTLLTT